MNYGLPIEVGQAVCFSGNSLFGDLAFAVFQMQWAAFVGKHPEFGQGTVFPAQIHGEGTAGPETGNGSGGPPGGQGWQDVGFVRASRS